MRDSIEVVEVAVVDDELIRAMESLVPQLTATAPIPTDAELREIVDPASTTLLLARDRAAANRIVGTLTLAMFRIPTGLRAWIEDVTVDAAARGRGVGEALRRAAIRIPRAAAPDRWS